ncbi:hypothetical protein TWF281_006143 [Arthrobotrys megalospora]
MGNTALPIPIELVFDILQRCGRQDVYSFARTSKAHYDASVHLLYKHIDLVVALKSGALERHEKYGVYDFVQVVDLPIGFSSPEFFANAEAGDPVGTVHDHLLKFKNIQELHLLIAEDEYSKTGATARILRYVFTDFISRLSTLFLEIYGFNDTELELENILTDLAASTPTGAPNIDRLKKMKSWVTHSRPRRLMTFVAPLLSPFVSNLETIEVRTRCNLEHDAERDWRLQDLDFMYLRGLESESIKFAAIEDKNSSSSQATCRFIRKSWPNLVELELDLGVNHYLLFYYRLSRLKHLRKLEIMYPYQNWDSEVQENMAEESRYPARRLCEKIPSLQEISIKYMGGDGSMSQTAVFNCIRTKSRPDEQGNQSETIELELKELWGEKGDYEDIISMIRLVRQSGSVLVDECRERIERYILVDELKVEGFELPEEVASYWLVPVQTQ